MRIEGNAEFLAWMDQASSPDGSDVGGLIGKLGI